MNTKIDTKIHSTHAYMLMLMSRPSSLAHKLLMLMLVLMLASLVRTGLLKEDVGTSRKVGKSGKQTFRKLSLINLFD